MQILPGRSESGPPSKQSINFQHTYVCGKQNKSSLPRGIRSKTCGNYSVIKLISVERLLRRKDTYITSYAWVESKESKVKIRTVAGENDALYVDLSNRNSRTSYACQGITSEQKKNTKFHRNRSKILLFLNTNIA